MTASVHFLIHFQSQTPKDTAVTILPNPPGVGWIEFQGAGSAIMLLRCGNPPTALRSFFAAGLGVFRRKSNAAARFPENSIQPTPSLLCSKRMGGASLGRRVERQATKGTNVKPTPQTPSPDQNDLDEIRRLKLDERAAWNAMRDGYADYNDRHIDFAQLRTIQLAWQCASHRLNVAVDAYFKTSPY